MSLFILKLSGALMGMSDIVSLVFILILINPDLPSASLTILLSLG
jgi:hypothetical protein